MQDTIHRLWQCLNQLLLILYIRCIFICYGIHRHKFCLQHFVRDRKDLDIPSGYIFRFLSKCHLNLLLWIKRHIYLAILRVIRFEIILPFILYILNTVCDRKHSCLRFAHSCIPSDCIPLQFLDLSGDPLFFLNILRITGFFLNCQIRKLLNTKQDRFVFLQLMQLFFYGCLIFFLMRDPACPFCYTILKLTNLILFI